MIAAHSYRNETAFKRRGLASFGAARYNLGSLGRLSGRFCIVFHNLLLSAIAPLWRSDAVLPRLAKARATGGFAILGEIMGYHEEFTVEGYAFIASIDGLLIIEHPEIDQSYLNALRTAITIFDGLKPFIEYLNGGGTEIKNQQDALQCASYLPNWYDYSAFAALTKAILDRPDYNIVLPDDLYWLIGAAYERYFPSQPTQKRITAQHPLNPGGYIYLLKSTSGYWKIGRTRNPDDRIQTFTVKLPFEVEYEHLIPCSDCIIAERQLHAQFADKRVNGEWFALTPEDVEEIKSITEMGVFIGA